jgi:hypothetical protein
MMVFLIHALSPVLGHESISIHTMRLIHKAISSDHRVWIHQQVYHNDNTPIQTKTTPALLRDHRTDFYDDRP